MSIDPNVAWAKAIGALFPLLDVPDSMSILQVVEAWNEFAAENRRLREGLARAIEVLETPWKGHRFDTARDLRKILRRLQSSGNPGQLSDPVTDRHDVNWGSCPKCGCTDLSFTGWPHGPSEDVRCAKCGWSGVFVDNRETDVIQELRDAGLNAWDSVDDPEGYIQEMRS